MRTRSHADNSFRKERYQVLKRGSSRIWTGRVSNGTKVRSVSRLDKKSGVNVLIRS